MASPSIVTLTSQNFAEEVSKSPVPVLVDFWAEWCGPCKMIAPALEELANEYAGKAKVAKINVDHERELTAQFGVNAMPTFLVFKGGQPAAQQVGISGGKARLKSMLDAALS